MFRAVFCKSLFVLLLLATVLSVLQLIASDYPFGIFKIFLDRFQTWSDQATNEVACVAAFLWFSRNHVNMFEWSDMSTRGFAGLIQSKDHHLIEMELVLAIQLLTCFDNNNHSCATTSNTYKMYTYCVNQASVSYAYLCYHTCVEMISYQLNT